ncbi:hypothetical protein BH24BAC1_BH24BAC1_28600 [soil metagenome]
MILYGQNNGLAIYRLGLVFILLFLSLRLYLSGSYIF